MILKDLGEFNFIDRIRRTVKVSKGVVKGIGDDAAVLKYKLGRYALFTSDMLMEGRHFYRSSGGYLIGKKALSVNVSDIAAMGGSPSACLVSLGVPRSLDVRFTDSLYRGIMSVARQYKIDLAGGDTVGSRKIVINIALLGEVEQNNLVLRSTAKRGDVVFVTGRIGGSLKKKHLDFTPRLKESRFLVKNFKVNSMIDVSDGLIADLGHILNASRKSGMIYEKNIPISKDAKNFNNAVRDGEDFELVFTIARSQSRRLIKTWPFKTRLSMIGEISSARNGELGIVRKNGKIEYLNKKGFSHF